MDKPRLRSTLKKLNDIDFGDDPIDKLMAPQEMLDFLAMLDGQKPVYLLGRGFDHPEWVSGVSQIGLNLGLRIHVGPFWRVGQPDILPDWITNHTGRAQSLKKAVYIAKARNSHDRLVSISDRGGEVDVAEEAELLGYPKCCVIHHHERAGDMDRLFMLMLERVSAGDEGKKREIVLGDIGMEAETAEEKELANKLRSSVPIPYTSINACPACAKDRNSPGHQIGESYRALAEAIDSKFAARVGASIEI